MNEELTKEKLEEVKRIKDYIESANAEIYTGNVIGVVTEDFCVSIDPVSGNLMIVEEPDTPSIKMTGPVAYFILETGNREYKCLRHDGSPFYIKPETALSEKDIENGHQLSVMAQDLSDLLDCPTLGVLLMCNDTLEKEIEAAGGEYKGLSFLDDPKLLNL